MNRNETLENSVKSWLNRSNMINLGLEEKGMLFSALIKLYNATQEKEYATCVVSALDSMTGEDGTIAEMNYDDNHILNFFVGNALFFALEQTSKEKYKNAIMKLAKQLKNQPRNAEGIFKVSNLNTDEIAIKDVLYSQVFYMNYESVFGGKEHYNDIIAQYNSLRQSVYYVSADKKELAMYSCALIDTMEVMEQPIYEIYRRLQELLKEAVATMVTDNTENKDAQVTKVGVASEGGVVTEADLLCTYAVLKACRMKALLTEKYEGKVLTFIEKAVSKLTTAVSENMSANALADFRGGDDILYTSALLLAYAESLRNREYQDYGRSKGGTLWN